MTADSPIQREFSWNVHSYLNEYIRFADAKAFGIMAWISALFGAMLSFELNEEIRKVAWTLGREDLFRYFAAIGTLALAASFIVAVMVVFPKLPTGKLSPGYIFWLEVCQLGSGDQYCRSFAKLDEAGLNTQVSSHIYVLSTIARTKYNQLNLSFWIGIGGTVAVAICVFLSNNPKP